MTKKKRDFFNAAFLIVVLILTIYSVFHGENLSDIWTYLHHGDVRYWAIGAVMVVLFIGCESVIIFYMMRVLGQQIKLSHCFLYSFVGFFFSLITPSATGGQPAQLYFMKKDKLSLPVSTMVLLIVTITYKMVLVVLGVVVLALHPAAVMVYLEPVAGWCILGIVLNVICVLAMFMLVFHPTLAETILFGIIGVIDRIFRCNKTDKYKTRFHAAMDKYRQAAEFFGSHKRVIFNVFIITCVQRLLLFAVTYVTYVSFALSGVGFWVITTLQGMISVAVDMLPLPGGLGISEKLFVNIFKPICGECYTLPVMIVSRGLSYYTQLMISAVMTVTAYCTIAIHSDKR